MSTLDGVNVEFDGEKVTASWADAEEGAAMGLTASRAVVEGGDLGNVASALVDDIRQAIDKRDDFGRLEL